MGDGGKTPCSGLDNFLYWLSPKHFNMAKKSKKIHSTEITKLSDVMLLDSSCELIVTCYQPCSIGCGCLLNIQIFSALPKMRYSPTDGNLGYKKMSNVHLPLEKLFSPAVELAQWSIHPKIEWYVL